MHEDGLHVGGEVLRVGLTGGIAAGKSVAARRLGQLGAAVVDHDVLARTVVDVGTPGLAALSLIVAALTSGLRAASMLGGLLALPLAVPLLIFGASFVERGGDTGALKLLAAVSLILVAAAPFAAGAAMRASRD